MVMRSMITDQELVKIFRLVFEVIPNLQGDGTTWEIHLGTRLCVKVVPPLTYSTLNVLVPNGQ